MTTSALAKPLSTDPAAAQRAASDPGASVWVNASAGSGKTTVLVNRVTRLLLDGVPPQKILCLTYTRAGAAEMANRVTATLSKWATCDDETLDTDLDALQNHAPKPRQRETARRLFAKTLSCPGGLRIRTIHSFCQEILSRFPIEAGLPPHFALIDEQDMETLRRATLDEMLREAGENPQIPLAQTLDLLVAAQGEHGFTDMLQEVTHARGKIAAAVAQAGGLASLIDKIRAMLELDPDDMADSFRRDAMQNLDEKKLRPLAQWLAQGTKTHSDRAAILSDILATPPDLRAARFDDYRLLFLTLENTPRKAFANNDLLRKYPDIQSISEHEATLLQLLLERIESADIAQITAAVLSFGTAYADRLARRKAARAALDYDDLILLTEKLLCRPGIAPWILYKLDNGIDHILVDEAQDTSQTQWRIVQALSEEFFSGAGVRPGANRTLFVVGDEKQSIFSFQNADPESFLSLKNFFDAKIAAAGKKLDKIPMHASFRSAPAILGAVDAIFADPDVRAGVSPDPVAHSATPDKNGHAKSGRVEIWPLLTGDTNAASDDIWPMPLGYEEEQDPQAELARQIAQKIKHWLARGEMLSGFTRPVAPGDIMILLRRRGRFADLMVRALKAADIPVTGVDRMHLVSQLPVMDLLALLRFVLLPEDDLNLASLLRSPLINISEDELMQLAIGRDGSLWNAVKNNPAFTTAHDYLAARLAEADFSTPFAFLSQALNTPCPGNAASGRMALWARLGDPALDPIEELLNAAQHFTRRHAPSLQNFLRWLTQADAEIKRELDHGDRQDGGDKQGQVRIMTVHAAKGLEAPIVFLPDTAAVPRGADMPKLQWDKSGIPLFLTRQPTFGAAQGLWQQARDKQLQEYRRLFYVALTRASHRLYLCGWQSGKADTGPDSWHSLAAEALRPLHQEHHRAEPEAEIIFADPPSLLAPVSQIQIAPPEKIIPPAWISRAVEVTRLPSPLRGGVGEGGGAASAALNRQTPLSLHPPTPHPPPARGEGESIVSPDSAFTRGLIIHRLLQSLPDIAPASRPAAAARFLAQPRHNLTAEQQNDIAREVTRLIDNPNFQILFSPNSLAEAPLTGNIDGIPVLRQIDRLCLHQGEVWIVDYKTNRPPPQSAADIPEAYRRQLSEYRILLRGIYPDKNIRCFLLWTYAPELMEIAF